MEVSRYTFRSPYPNQVQIGTPDPSVKQEKNAQQQSSELVQNTNQTLSNAQSFQATQTQDVTPTVSSSNSIDVYA